MEIVVLKDRIAKKEQDIQKLDKKIAKHANNINDPTLIAMANDTIGIPWGQAIKSMRDYANENEISYSQVTEADDLRSAYISKRDATATLNKYKDQLRAEIEKNKQTNADNRIEVIWTFLQNWKVIAEEFYINNIKVLDEYYKVDSQVCDLHNSSYSFKKTHTEEEIEKFLSNMKDMEIKAKNLKAEIEPLTRDIYSRKEPDHCNHELLNKELDKEVKRKYIKMVEQVTKYTGEITDASLLEIDPRGDINGYITGKEGRAHLQTILAGGYNIQRLHFRVLVKAVR